MTLLFLVLALAIGGPFLFRYIDRRSPQHRSLWIGWTVAIAACVLIPVLVVGIDWRATALSRVDVPLPLLILIPLAWGMWLALRRQAGNGHSAS